jgi:diaminohydroxyphosphoribosylaminopyrimidine deaminase / 5-amino-6-(5-phosphoribosylamino)uracil reductase
MNDERSTLEAWMRRAMAEAALASGRTHPNPAVGALIVDQGTVVASGHTQPPPGAHAEVMAIAAWRSRGQPANPSTTLVVTMEPCCTHGRTPPCTQAIIDSGIRTVVIGATDPNPRHAGRGHAALRAAGITVLDGILAADCADQNLIFNHWIVHNRPLFAGKIATTIDGRIATRGGHSKWITGAAARADVMRWRRTFPAIAVGAGTVLADNPQLTARIAGEAEWTPLRFIFDRNLTTLRDTLPQVYTDEQRARTVIVAMERRAAEAASHAARLGVQSWALTECNNDGGLHAFAERCASEGITGLYIEGGAQLLSGFLRARLLDYLFAYRAPRLLADPAALAPFFGCEPPTIHAAIQLQNVRHATFGDDALMRGTVCYPPA